MEKDDLEFEQKYGKYALKNCIPESERRVRSWLKKKNREPGQMGDLEKEDVYLTLMTALMGGDIHLFLNIMATYMIDQNNMGEGGSMLMRTANLARSTFKMMKISGRRCMLEIKRIFKPEPSEDREMDEGVKQEEEEKKAPGDGKVKQKGRQHKEEGSDFAIIEFAEQLSGLNVLYIEKKIQGLNRNSQDYERDLKKYEFAKELFSNPDILKYGTSVLLSAKYGLLGKQVITTMIVEFVQKVLDYSKVDPLIKDCFILLVEIFSGRKLEEIQNMTEDGLTYSFLEKVEKLVKIVMKLFLPDL